jgi:hypothetical protein
MYCHVEGSQKANFMGIFPLVWGLSPDEPLYTGAMPFTPA